MSRLGSFALLAAAQLAIASPAAAQAPLPWAWSGYAQSFTAPSGPAYLQSVNYGAMEARNLSGGADVVRFTIVRLGDYAVGSDGWGYVGIAEPPVFEQSVPGAFVAPFQSVAVGAWLIPGQTYAFLLAVRGQEGGVAGNPRLVDDFAGGTFMACWMGGTSINANTCSPSVGADIEGFSVTFASTTAPEPATLALLGTGLAALGVVARRRRAR